MIDYKIEAYSISAIIIMVAGLLKLYIYYKLFNISILPFLEPGEILTIFFDNLLSFLGFWVAFMSVLWIFYNTSVDRINSIHDISFLQRLTFYGFFKWNKVWLLIGLSIGLFLFIKLRASINFYEFYLWMGILIAAIYILPIIILELNHSFIKNNVTLHIKTNIFLFSALTLLISAPLFSLNEVYKVKKKHFYIGTEFELENNQKINSTLNYYYIGKTKQFVFFYNNIDQKTEVIPVSRFTKMKF